MGGAESTLMHVTLEGHELPPASIQVTTKAVTTVARPSLDAARAAIAARFGVADIVELKSPRAGVLATDRALAAAIARGERIVAKAGRETEELDKYTFSHVDFCTSWASMFVLTFARAGPQCSF